MIGRRVLGLVALIVVAGCEPAGPEAPFTSLGSSPDALRDAFNADVGSVRLLMLAAPT